MTSYLQIKDEVRRVVRHPGWRTGDTPETARLLTPDELVDHGFGLIVVDNPPAFDDQTQYLQALPIENWSIDARHAFKSYEIKTRPVMTIGEIRAAMPTLSPRQLRLTLARIGILETDIDQALADDPEGQIEWKWTTAFERTHPLIDMLGAAMSLPPEQIDDLWLYAAEI